MTGTTDATPIALCVLLLTIASAVARSRDARNPATWFASVWLVAIVPSVPLAPEAVSAATLLLVAAFVATVTLGSLLGGLRSRLSPGDGFDVAVAGRPAFAASAAGGLAGALAAALYVRASGTSVGELASGSAWIAMAARFSVARYHESYVEPLEIRLLLSVLYFGALFAGLLASVSRTRLQFAVAFAPSISAAVVTLITTAKAPLMLSALLTVSAHLATRSGSTARRRPWARVTALASAAASVALGSLFLRYAQDDGMSAASDVGRSIASYALGHAGALTAWLEWEGPFGASPSLGRNSIAGAFAVAGLMRRSAGHYTELPLNSLAEGSNVFTALRGLVEDFTLPGALLVALASAFVAQRSFRRAEARKGRWTDVVTLAAFYSFVGWSPIISIFNYNSIVAAFAAFAVTLALTDYAGRSHVESQR